MLIYNIGISAIRANQVALQTVANNIANAGTEGYHRQRVNLVESPPIVIGGFPFGTGVTVAGIERLRNAAVEQALTLNLSQKTQAQVGLDALGSIEQLLTPSSGSLQSRVSEFFSRVEQLAASPSEEILRRQVVSAAQGVAEEITNLNTGLDRLQTQYGHEIEVTVDRINQLTSSIADLNNKIRSARAQGSEPITLLDQKDLLVNELGSLVDISPRSLADEDGTLLAAGGWLVVGYEAQPLSVRRADDGSLEVVTAGGQGPVIPASGKLAAQLTIHNEWIPQTRDSMMEWTSAFLSGVDSLQATGLGLSGPANVVVGTRSVADASVVLSQSGSLFPISAGELYVTVTEVATGVRTTHRIAIDPDVDSLNDVVAGIDALAGVQASVQPGNGRVRITADSGYAVDFAGRPDSLVDLSGVTGTATPTISGNYQGTDNSQWTVTALSDGEIGVTPGLRLRVTNSVTGAVLADLDVGQGYQANQPIALGAGLFLKLSPGTLVSGDEFSVDAVGNPDSAGFLTALGIGTLFQTSDLRSVTVGSQYAAQPALLSASRSGDWGDASQLLRLVELRSAQVLSGGTETLEERLATLTSNTGVAVNAKQSELSQFQAQYDQLRNQQDAASGVDPNEELMNMLEFQRAFQANARVMSSMNETLDELLRLVG